MVRLTLLGIFLLACGGSSTEDADAGNGVDGGNLVCSAEESQVFCRDLVPEELAGPGCCGDLGAFGCEGAEGARCPGELVPASECVGTWSGSGAGCR